MDRHRATLASSTRKGPKEGASRIPAIVVLVLAAVGIVAVGLAIAGSQGGHDGREILIGVGGIVAPGNGKGATGSEAVLAALSEPLPAGATTVHVPILMYHYVDDTPPPAGPYADALTVRTPDFEEELDYLVENGYETVSLADVYLTMAGQGDLPEKPLVLTFDDGGLDNYEVAFPLLKERGLTATFFVISGSVGKEGQMSWEQLRDMAGQGMSIQSHSASHPDLRAVSDARLQSELAGSREAIVEAVGQPGYVLCYPSGAYDDRVIEAAKAAGYVMAVATGNGKELAPETVFEMKRRRVEAFLPLSSFATLVR